MKTSICPTVSFTVTKWLKYLKIPFFNQPISPGFFPETLERLYIYSGFDQDLVEGDLPKRLTHLRLGDSFTRPIQNEVLPKSLTFLDLGTRYDQNFPKNTFPPSLKTLVLPITYSGIFICHNISAEEIYHVESVDCWKTSYTLRNENDPRAFHIFSNYE